MLGHNPHPLPLSIYSCSCSPEWSGTLCTVRFDDCRGSGQSLCVHGMCIDADRVTTGQVSEQVFTSAVLSHIPTCSPSLTEHLASIKRLKTVNTDSKVAIEYIYMLYIYLYVQSPLFIQVVFIYSGCLPEGHFPVPTSTHPQHPPKCNNLGVTDGPLG